MIRDRPFVDPKFLRTRPFYIAAQSALSRTWTEPAALFYPQLGNDAARVQREGGVVGMGSHGEIPGLGYHWELEAHVQGGMTPLEALRAGTIGSATAMGRAVELGSIEAGKLADLVVLNSDPSVNIRNARDISYVMKNGRLYDAETLDEQWPSQRVAEKPWFAGERPPTR